MTKFINDINLLTRINYCSLEICRTRFLRLFVLTCNETHVFINYLYFCYRSLNLVTLT